MPSKKVIQSFAIVAIVALIAGLAVISDGFKVKNVKLNTQNIWILQAGDSQRYGRVNTEINELASSNVVTKPTSLVQAPTATMLFADENQKFVNVSSKNPIDFDEDTEDAVELTAKAPVVETGQTLAAWTDSDKKLSISAITDSGFQKPSSITFPDGVEAIDAVAITSNDKVLAFSSSLKKVFTYDPITQKWLDGADEIANPSSFSANVQFASIGTKWVLLDQDSGLLWISGRSESVEVLKGGQLQHSSPTGFDVFVAASNGLARVNLSSGELDQTVPSVSGAITARPRSFAGFVYATWLSESEGFFYSSETNEVAPLNYAAKKLDKISEYAKSIPVIHSNGETAVINDTYTGWAWSLPSGALIVGTQNWNSLKRDSEDCGDDCIDPPPPTDPLPPVAVKDSFGVRAGQLISLPVLLNDSDPNKDPILTVVPESLKIKSGDIEELNVSSGSQMVTVRMKDNAKGSAIFSYKISDGTGTPNSNTANVTLRVVADGDNDAPQWCSDAMPNCLMPYPEASVAPGSEVKIPYLDGWVDPDGDRFFISRAELVSGSGKIAYTAAGDLVFQSEDESDASSVVTARITVSDVKGAETSQDLAIQVRSINSFSFDSPVISVAVGEPKVVDFAQFASGAKGFISITKLAAGTGDTITLEELDSSRVRITASKVKPSILTLELKDSSGSVAKSLVRVNVVEEGGLKLSTAPVTVLISPGLDTSIDVFSAAHNPANRSLVISNIRTEAKNGALLEADRIKGGFLRVRGKTLNEVPGFVGIVRYTVSDGESGNGYKTEGQAFVYALPVPESAAPVALRDSITVRAGQSVEVDVLANDLGSPGVPLAIDSKSLMQNEETNCIPGGLIFAGGGKIRVVAPTEPGGYSCEYLIFATNDPLKSTRAVISIRVEADDNANRAPIAYDVVGRVRAGETVSIPVPRSGVDPDGDAVSVFSLGDVQGKKGAGYINPDGSSIEYTALTDASGQDTFTYKLVDSKGLASALATVKIAIIDTDPDTAPVTLNDYAEVLVGGENKVVMDPIANDYDPQPNADKPMKLVEGSVFPDVPENSANYTLWKDALKQDKNLLTITAVNSPMTMRYIYTAESSSGSRSSGYITIKVSPQAIDDAPDITDTFATQAQAAQFRTSGIDVLQGKVVWTSGDIGKLKLSFWGDSSGLSIVGDTKISGTVFPELQRVVIFKVSGTNFSGKEVSSYGFLHLPGTNPKITFDPSLSKQEVDEGKEVSFDMSELTNLETGLEIGKVKAHGVRSEASCSLQSGTQVTYRAGNGGPWSDFCDVQVKIAGSEEPFATLLVPISVIPNDPTPELRNQQLTIVPGTSSEQVYDLVSMTTWLGKSDEEKSGLPFQLGDAGDDFVIEKDGSKLTIQARGSAKPGSKKTIKISLGGSYSSTEAADLVLVVGQLPNNLPVAPTLALECSVSGGEAECQISADAMNSTPGAYNPFPDKSALRFAPMRYTSGEVVYGASRTCGQLSVKTESSRLFVTWNGEPTGVKCDVPYGVLDHEGRVGTSTLELTFKGIPGTVRSVSQVDYSNSSITLSITPPENSFPPIEEFEIVDESGDSTNCEAESNTAPTRCVIYNLNPYDGNNKSNLHTYSVKARNSEGLSAEPRVLKDAYAYQAPKKLSKSNIKAETVPDERSTFTQGYASVTVYPVSDSLIASYKITGIAGEETIKSPSSNFASFTVLVPAKPGLKSKITLEAIGAVPPPVAEKLDTNEASWIGRIAGDPKIQSIKAKPVKSGGQWVGKIEVTNAQRNYSNRAVKITFALFTGGTAPVCNPDGTIGSASASTLKEYREYSISDLQSENLTSPIIRGIQDNTGYTPFVCYSNGFDKFDILGVPISTLSDPSEGAFTYDISATPNAAGEWLLKLGRSETKAGVAVKAQFNSTASQTSGWTDTPQSSVFGAVPEIRVRYCLVSDPTACSPGERVIGPESKSRSMQMSIDSIANLKDYFDPANPVVTAACSPSHDVEFVLTGKGLTSGTKKLWQIQGTPVYKTATGATVEMDKPGDYWRFKSARAGTPTEVTVSFIGLQTNARVKGLTGAVTKTFTCR
jgi:hypothetical protein